MPEINDAFMREKTGLLRALKAWMDSQEIGDRDRIPMLIVALHDEMFDLVVRGKMTAKRKGVIGDMVRILADAVLTVSVVDKTDSS